MRRNIVVVGLLMAFVMLVMTGCPKKTPPPPPPPPSEEQPTFEPQIEEPQVEQPPEVKPLDLRAVYFDYDKYDLKDEAKAILTDNAQQLMDNKDVKVLLAGNCDERGTEKYNLSLGQKRADAVKSFLVDYGIESSRISTISYGEEKPVCTDHNESCWSRCRRVDFTVKE